MKRAFLSLVLAAACLGLTAGEMFRTDINPALLYWQAVAEWPALSQSDHDYIYTNDWHSRPLDDRLRKLLREYDNSFKLIRRAGHARAPIDWGLDLTDGPEALLPGLAKYKAAAQAARLRTYAHLRQGDQSRARDELIAVWILARNASRDGILISALVQIAIENIVTAAICENFYLFTPETLREIRAGFDSAPPRGTIAQALPAERFSFSGWLLRSVDALRAEGKSDAEMIAAMRDLMQRSFTQGANGDPRLGERIVQAAGGTTEGLVRYIQQLDQLYDEADQLMTSPWSDYASRIETYNDRLHAHPNLLVGVFFPPLKTVRGKEFAAEVNLGMLRAGIEYRLSGPEALARFQDPVLKERFGFSRLSVDGVDRGFMLTSNLQTRDFQEKLAFIEKEGPSVHVIGKNTGRKSKP